MSRLNFRDTESISHRPSLTSRCRRHTQDKVPFAFYLPPVPLGLATLGAQSVAGGGAGTTLHVGHYHLVLLKLRDPDRQITALPAYGPVLIRHRTAALLLHHDCCSAAVHQEEDLHHRPKQLWVLPLQFCLWSRNAVGMKSVQHAQGP